MAVNPILLAQTVGINQATSVPPTPENIQRMAEEIRRTGELIEQNRREIEEAEAEIRRLGNKPPPEVNNSPNNPPPENSNVPPQQPTSEPVNPRPNTTITDTSVSGLNRTVSQPNVLENIPSISDASAFTIKYVDTNNVEQIYRFSLLPAVESKLASGSQVPEVKPGILIKTSMNIKRFLVPGGAPMFQMLGAEQTILQLVGLLIGNESLTANRVLPALKKEEELPSLRLEDKKAEEIKDENENWLVRRARLLSPEFSEKNRQVSQEKEEEILRFLGSRGKLLGNNIVLDSTATNQKEKEIVDFLRSRGKLLNYNVVIDGQPVPTTTNPNPTIPNLPPTPENIRRVGEEIRRTGEKIEQNTREIEILEQQIAALNAGNGLDPASSLYKEDPELDSHAVAKKLDLNVVQLGKPVEIRIISHNANPKVKPFELRYNCLLQSFRYFVARNDRTYYALDALVLDYLTVTDNQLPMLSADVLKADNENNASNDTNSNNNENKEVRQSD
jgi:hypothetical protein